MKYIAVEIEFDKLQIGGFGHILHDVLSAYLIARLTGSTYVHYPFKSLGDDYHRDRTVGAGKYDSQVQTDRRVSWDEFTRFGEGEVQIEDVRHLPTRALSPVQPFSSIPIEDLENLMAEDDVLYLLHNNNRVLLEEVYAHDRELFDSIMPELKAKFIHLCRPPSAVPTAAIHIRRGDWDWQPLTYDVNMIQLLDDDYDIVVHSLGSEDQLQEIRDVLGPLSPRIQFRFNEPVMDTIIALYNADVVIGGHSGFPKMITTFSDNLFIYLPYNDGETQVLGGPRFPVGWHGRAPEEYETHRRIRTNIRVLRNRDLIERRLKERLQLRNAKVNCPRASGDSAEM